MGGETRPLITVIVPVYNVEKYLNRCINSIIEQTYCNLEIIIVDDGSTDSCPSMCDTWARRDSRIKVIHQPNKGLSGARNTGLDLAKGEYIGFVDSDDYISKDMYEILLKEIKNNSADISIIGVSKVYNNGEKHFVGPKIGNMVMTASDAFKYINLPGYFDIAAWNKLTKKTLFKNVRFPENEKVSEDYPVAFALIARAKKIVYNSKPCYLYCQHQGTLSSKVSDAKYRYTKDMLQFVKNTYPEDTFFALYGHMVASLAVYDTILVNGQRDAWLDFEKEIISLFKSSFSLIRNQVPLTKARFAQLSVFYHFPRLYRVLFPLYKRIFSKTVD